MITKSHAESIARKLGALIKNKKKHDFAIIKYNGKIIAQYGIRRSSSETGHGHLPSQLFISPMQCRQLAACPLSNDDYFEILRQKGKLPQ